MCPHSLILHIEAVNSSEMVYFRSSHLCLWHTQLRPGFGQYDELSSPTRGSLAELIGAPPILGAGFRWRSFNVWCLIFWPVAAQLAGVVGTYESDVRRVKPPVHIPIPGRRNYTNQLPTPIFTGPSINLSVTNQEYETSFWRAGEYLFSTNSQSLVVSQKWWKRPFVGWLSSKIIR